MSIPCNKRIPTYPYPRNGVIALAIALLLSLSSLLVLASERAEVLPTAATPVQDMQPGGGGGWSSVGLIVNIPVVITGFGAVHFDVYDHIAGDTRVRFAPFSHDAEYTPEPGSLLLLLSGTGGVLGLGACRRVVSRRRRGSAA